MFYVFICMCKNSKFFYINMIPKEHSTVLHHLGIINVFDSFVSLTYHNIKHTSLALFIPERYTV